ncbi:MAPEG family protein [Pseudoteredinibacter isoporae]|uniref:Putative MAPEG superfamily protein n=1 Tax=Pseudoteredinibacter isoporae TaxID=570281 RepID=A0A7X0JSQ4_9GAMM|nr:MAPEG family protein [Pseudoteredinibacter isoporae]MBB6520691.1 putative MAPEG superfamily protein [Pseudoteredinibacter isoporae]NHO86258.1 MAPEG family protein [Pseudoteredinibacter isoporae]NIB25291.1 MAPEG family protein [Pseudoteredinibacter isoporae]
MNAIALYMLFNLLLLGLTKAPVAIAMARLGRYNNASPRDQQTELSGWGKRALAAHQNAIEAIPIFGLALLTAAHLELPMEDLHLYAGGFVISRVLYQLCYLADWATLRSIVWIAGYGFCVALVASSL